MRTQDSILYCDIKSDASSYAESIIDLEEDVTDYELKEMIEDEKLDIKYLSIFENEYSNFDEKNMSLKSSEEFKNIEGSIINRTNKGYYQHKIKHQQLYEECVSAHSKYCIPEMLAILQHKYSMQKNEAKNHSVATMAPKTKTFSKSSSLKTRVMFCAGAQFFWQP